MNQINKLDLNQFKSSNRIYRLACNANKNIDEINKGFLSLREFKLKENEKLILLEKENETLILLEKIKKLYSINLYKKEIIFSYVKLYVSLYKKDKSEFEENFKSSERKFKYLSWLFYISVLNYINSYYSHNILSKLLGKSHNVTKNELIISITSYYGEAISTLFTIYFVVVFLKLAKKFFDYKSEYFSAKLFLFIMKNSEYIIDVKYIKVIHTIILLFGLVIYMFYVLFFVSSWSFLNKPS